MSRQGGGYFGARPFGVAGRLCGAAGVPGAVGPGRCVCRCAAARPLAVRAASFARRVVSKPALALPPPTGTAVRPTGYSSALHTGGTWCAVVSDWLRIHLVCGTKFALHARNLPKRAISSEQGEFYTARAMRRGVSGELYTEVARRGSYWGVLCRHGAVRVFSC